MHADSPTGASEGTNSPASWGAPLARFDAIWTRFEAKLCAGVLVAEILALCLWIAMKGLSTPTTHENKAGLVFRAIIGAVVLGLVAQRALRGQPDKTANAGTVAAVVLGLLSGAAWTGIGVSYFSNVLNWQQDASTLTLIGGLRGVGTRLTLWLALLGASLATASGKHINVDVVMRFLKPSFRMPVAVAGWLAASLVCLSSVWGFFDHIAIESFGAKADSTPSEKIALVEEHHFEHMFLLRKQIGLDFMTLPHVLAGEKYDAWMKGGEWNAWVKSGGWESHYSADQIANVLVPAGGENETHPPLVVVPGGTNRGILGHDLYFVFPFGLLMIGLRFVLRSLLAISGHVIVDPDAAHVEDDLPPQSADDAKVEEVLS